MGPTRRLAGTGSQCRGAALRGYQHLGAATASWSGGSRSPRKPGRTGTLRRTCSLATGASEGRRLLERAITERKDFAFETTLGGKTIAGLLHQAAAAGFEVRVWYAGLTSPELHIARVRARVSRGGHDIPEVDIRRRYDDGRLHLIDLLPELAELWVYDNSEEGDPNSGIAPQPRLVLHWSEGKIVAPADLSSTPDWAKPIVAAAVRLKGVF